MKKAIWASMVILSLGLSACSGTPAKPTTSAEDIQATAVAAAFTVVAQTQAAIPTKTPIPPTDTPEPTPLPTDTPVPTPTRDPSLASPTEIPTLVPTFTAQPVTSSSNNGDPCNQPLTEWTGPTANFTVTNETSPQGTLVLSLYVVSDFGDCGYLYVNRGSASGPIGQYSAGAFVTGKQNFKVFGSFRITEGSWDIIVRNNSIVAKGGCYPNC